MMFSFVRSNGIAVARKISVPARLLKASTLLLCALAFLFSASITASAQLSGKGSITGTVTDPTGAVVPGAVITATNTATGIATTQTSSSAGDFTMPTLDAGVYVITVKASGFETITQKDVHINALEAFSYSPKLTIGTTDQNITVDTAPPALETSNATLGATMEHEMYSALPIEMGAYGQPDQRRASDFAFLMPGVQGNNTNGNPTTNTGVINGSGSRGAVSAVYIDGLPFVRAGGNGDPRFVWTAISVDAVDQFQVQTSGYSAIYEGQGIQNYTLKAGGLKYHGSIYEFFRNTALDTYGFFGKAPSPATGLVHKPIEHSNEYGINLSGPLIPFGALKDKLFFFGNYNGFRFANETPTAITFPTAAQQAGNFQGVISGGIFDPNTQAACTAVSTTGPCRYRYGYVYAGAPGAAGNPILGPAGAAGVDVIPSSEFSTVALNMQKNLPQGIGTAVQNNYISPNRSGLTNFSTSERVDFTQSAKNQITLIGAIGRQASSNPVAQTTTGRNVGPVPYNYGQAYAPKTAVGIVEDTYTISTHIVNQLKYGYARYNGPTFDSDQTPAYAATAEGISNLPIGQAPTAFPITTFAGTNAPTNWAGTTANIVLAQNYTLVDNLQWSIGKHSLTFGGQIAWLLYDQVPATGGSTPLTLAEAVTETAAITPSTNAKPAYAVTSNTGLSYASFLIGQNDKPSFTSYLRQEFGSRFRAISPYVQDNWKVTPKLTLDLGVRYDYFPPLRENVDAMSFFNPSVVNPITGVGGSLQFAGHGANTCNCDTVVAKFYKNIGPRIGLAYQLDPKTVLRASYGVMYTHGNGVGGGTASVTGGSSNSLGFSASPQFAASGQLLSTAPFTGTNGALPGYTLAAGTASGPSYGTGYTTATGYTGTPSTMAYYDPYLGGRAPQYINFTFGLQHQWSNAFTTGMTYSGSEGHFSIADGSNARGFYADQLDPRYLTLGSNLSLTGTALTTYCAANAGVCPATLGVFNTSQPLSTLLKPYPFQGVTDFFDNVSNSVYHSLQLTANMRPTKGLTFMANYTWSRSIDDGGTFRTGYAIPAGTITNAPSASYQQDRIERSVSTSSQPHHVVVTGVYALPFGQSVLNGNAVERAIVGGFKLSEIFQAYSGSPLPITGASCPTNPADSTCMPIYNPTYNSTNARVNGKHWGQGVTYGNYNTTNTTPTGAPIAQQFISPLAFAYPNAYQFGNTPRTAPYGLTGPGNYNLDLALVRSFPLKFTETAHLNFRAEWYNVTNHTKFAVASMVYGNSNFGEVTTDPTATRKSAQFSARIEF
jgi:hypothetical protein